MVLYQGGIKFIGRNKAEWCLTERRHFLYIEDGSIMLESSMRLILIVLILVLYASCERGGYSRTILGRESVEAMLDKSLQDKASNKLNEQRGGRIADSLAAVLTAEKMLFDVYGEQNIKRQRPYEIHKIRNFWCISGTLPVHTTGGTFFIILDETDGRTVTLSHGK